MKLRVKIAWFVLLFIAIGLIFPQNLKMPVEGADANSYNANSFWFYPWGKSITHKGIDIFAEKETTIKSSTQGLVVFSGKVKRGGNAVLILGPKWRLHYYAHLETTKVERLSWVNHSTLIGTVGDSGNAKGKPSHLHYSILSLIPYPWRIDSDKQGWRKMFYLNPIDYL